MKNNKKSDIMDEKPGRTKTRLTLIVVSIAALILAGAIAALAIFAETDKVIMRCNGVDITESVYKMYFYQAAAKFETDNKSSDMSLDQFWRTEINGKLPIITVRENVTSQIKVHAYESNKCANEKITVSPEEYKAKSADLEANYKDFDSQNEIGVKLKYFIAFLIEQDNFDTLMINEMAKINVTQDEIKKYFDANRGDNAKVTVKTIFISNEDKTIKNIAEYMDGIKKELDGGANMDDLINKYSQNRGNNNGLFEIVNTSLIGNDFGSEYIKSVLNSNPGDVAIVKTSTGYCLNQTIKVDWKSFSQSDITKAVKEDIYTNNMLDVINKNPGLYKIEIIDQKAVEAVGIPNILKGGADDTSKK